jgi:pilus assembly protein Flp/PilA
MKNVLARVLVDDSGQGLVEYGLILTFVAVAAIAALVSLGGGINGTLSAISGAL